jgi:hypothetical protein
MTMGRKKTMGNDPQDDGESDLIDRNVGGGLETGDAIERAEFSEAAPPRQGDGVGVADDAADDAKADIAERVEDEAAAARVASAPTGSASERTAIKRANFKRLCDKRVTKILTALDVLKNLANTNTYDWTQDQHDKIFNTIDEQLKEVRKAFEAAKKPKVRDKSQLRFEV